MAKTEITPEKLQEIASSEIIRQKLRAKANRMLPRAQRLAAGAGAIEFGRALRATEGTRPGTRAAGGLKRPYARIEAEITPEIAAADADAKLTRRQILRRATSA